MKSAKKQKQTNPAPGHQTHKREGKGSSQRACTSKEELTALCRDTRQGESLSVATNAWFGEGMVKHFCVRGAGRDRGETPERGLCTGGDGQSLPVNGPWERVGDTDFGFYTREKLLLVLPTFPLHSTCCSKKNCGRVL